MILERVVIVNDREYPVVISDDPDSLQAAYAAGKAVVALWDPKRPQASLAPARYAVERPEDADLRLLTLAVCRRFRLPAPIAVTDRLIIREFSMDDLPQIPAEEEAGEDDQFFRSPETLYEYIQNQYGFFGYGLWAVVERESGILAGKAGITRLSYGSAPEGQELIWPLHSRFSVFSPGVSLDWQSFLQRQPADDTFLPVELSYHIFRPFRRKGYALEACRAVLSYCQEQISPDIFARIRPDNIPSRNLVQKLIVW